MGDSNPLEVSWMYSRSYFAGVPLNYINKETNPAPGNLRDCLVWGLAWNSKLETRNCIL